MYASENNDSAYYEWRPQPTNVIHKVQGDWAEENEEAVTYIQNKPKHVNVRSKDNETVYWCGVEASSITIEQAYHLALSCMPYLFYGYEDYTKYSCGPVQQDLYISTLIYGIVYRKDSSNASNSSIEVRYGQDKARSSVYDATMFKEM